MTGEVEVVSVRIVAGAHAAAKRQASCSAPDPFAFGGPELSGRQVELQRRHSFRRSATTDSGPPLVARTASRPQSAMTSTCDSPRDDPQELPADQHLGLSENQYLALLEMRGLFADTYSEERVGGGAPTGLF